MYIFLYSFKQQHCFSLLARRFSFLLLFFFSGQEILLGGKEGRAGHEMGKASKASIIDDEP
jgi:hypothetical protein